MTCLETQPKEIRIRMYPIFLFPHLRKNRDGWAGKYTCSVATHLCMRSATKFTSASDNKLTLPPPVVVILKPYPYSNAIGNPWPIGSFRWRQSLALSSPTLSNINLEIKPKQLVRGGEATCWRELI